MRLVALVGLVVMGLVATPSSAHASCAGREPTQVVAGSDVLPEGSPGATALTDAAGPARAPTGDGTARPGSAETDLGDGGGMSLTTMVVIGLVGLLVVTFGGLALAVGLGLLTRRRRGPTAGSDDGTQPDSAGTPFK